MPAAASSASARRSRPSPTGSSSPTSSALGPRASSAPRPATIKVADRVHDASQEPARVLEPHRDLVQLRRRTCAASATSSRPSVEAPFDRQPSTDPRSTRISGGTMGADHPVAWCKDYQGGRSFYTDHGSSAASFDDANLAKEVLGAIQWAAGVSDPIYSDCGATVLRQLSADRSSPRPRTSASRSASTCCPTAPAASSRPTAAAVSVSTTRPRNSTDAARRRSRSTSQQRGRDVRPRDRQRLRDQPLGLPVLLAADGRGRQARRRLDRHADDAAQRPGDAAERAERAELRRVAQRLGPVRRLLPALALQVRRRDRRRHRPTSTSPPSSRSSASRTTAAPAATSPATSTSTRTTTCGSSPATTRRPAAATPAASVRSTAS